MARRLKGQLTCKKVEMEEIRRYQKDLNIVYEHFLDYPLVRGAGEAVPSL